MTPKEKANELVEKLSNYACWGRFEDKYENLQNSKQCALIAEEELIEATDYYYWTEVKKEIEKL